VSGVLKQSVLLFGEITIVILSAIIKSNKAQIKALH
jgi:hypothetical protein